MSKDKTIAIFDIASSSIGALLLQKQTKGKPTILSSKREQISFPKEKNFSASWPFVERSIVSLFSFLEKSSPNKNIDMAMCVFSAPWYIAQTRITKTIREKNFKINESFMEELIDDEAHRFGLEWGSKIPHEKEKEEDVFIEKTPLKANLNGYEVNNFLNKEVGSLEMFSYFSLSQGSLKEKIKEQALPQIHEGSVFFHSFPFVVFKILSGVANMKEGAVVVDISGEITDIFIMRNGIIEEVNSFPKGENFFIDSIAKTFGKSLVDARSLFLKYQRKDLKDDVFKKVDLVVSKALDEWQKSLGGLLIEIAKDRFLPQNLFLCELSSPMFSEKKMPTLLKKLEKRIESPDFANLTIFKKHFAIKLLSPYSLGGYFDNKSKGLSESDFSLLLSALFANKYLK